MTIHILAKGEVYNLFQFISNLTILTNEPQRIY